MQCIGPWKANRGEVSGNGKSWSGRLLVAFFRSGAQRSDEENGTIGVVALLTMGGAF